MLHGSMACQNTYYTFPKCLLICMECISQQTENIDSLYRIKCAWSSFLICSLLRKIHLHIVCLSDSPTLRDYLVITKRKCNKFSRVSHHKKSKPDTESRENNKHLSILSSSFRTWLAPLKEKKSSLVLFFLAFS